MDPKEQIKNGISAVDLGNCTQAIKDYYNISLNDSIIILNVELKKDINKTNEEDNSFNLGKTTQIEIYEYSGRKLDLSVCKEKIKIMKYINDVTEELNIQSAIDFADKGIDVFNAEDDFFNDICHQYNNSDGKDIALNDRRTEIYKNATFCDYGCIYNGMNYDLMVTNCLCDSYYLQIETRNKTNEEKSEENVNFKSVTKSFISHLFDFNFNVIYCINLVFDKQIIIKNIGFYSLASMFISQIIFF